MSTVKKDNSALIKKCVIFGILLLVLVLLVVSIIKSFTNYRYATTQSRAVDSSIPTGDYLDYIKLSVTGKSKDALDKIEDQLRRAKTKLRQGR